MFTGIVTAIGTISKVEHRQGNVGDPTGTLHAVITAPFDTGHLAIGASIACSGVCLTVVERGVRNETNWFAVDISPETLLRTAPDHWRKGAKLNLEGALKLGDELGGHIVTGHVDGIGKVANVALIGGARKLVIAAPEALAPFIAEKGSITLDGVSLTVNEVVDQYDASCTFALTIIPHTSSVTTLGSLQSGDSVNLEIDVLARYLKRLQSLQASAC